MSCWKSVQLPGTSGALPLLHPLKGPVPRPMRVAPCPFALPSGVFSVKAHVRRTLHVIRSACDGGSLALQLPEQQESELPAPVHFLARV